MTRTHIGDFEHYSNPIKLKTIAVTLPVYAIIRMYAKTHNISLKDAVGVLVGVSAYKDVKKDKPGAGLH